jgi:hypothetical protein
MIKVLGSLNIANLASPMNLSKTHHPEDTDPPLLQTATPSKTMTSPHYATPHKQKQQLELEGIFCVKDTKWYKNATNM